MYDIEKRKHFTTAAELMALLSSLPAEQELFVCGQSGGWYHEGDNGDTPVISLDSDPLDEEYEEGEAEGGLDKPAQDMEAYIRAELDRIRTVEKDGNGTYCYEIYADYQDRMESSTASEILTSNDPELALMEKLESWYEDYELECMKTVFEDEIRNTLTAKDGPYPNGFTEAEEGRFDDLMHELVYFKLPKDHFLDQQFCVNIMVDTGDENYDYTLNTPPFTQGIHDKAGITWLARQQGYTKIQLWNALEEGDIKDPHGFLETVRQETINCSTHMMVLTFMVQMRLRDLLELNRLIKLQDRNGHFFDATMNPDCGYIILDKKTTTGLYDPWNGAGSCLEVKLEKDVQIPIRFIRSALPDGSDGCSAASVYGMDSSAWTENALKCLSDPNA